MPIFNFRMKQLSLAVAVVFICFGRAWAGEDGIRWESKPLLAGKASLSRDGSYIVQYALGTLQTSPDLQFPLQLFYDSFSVNDTANDLPGLFGHGWRLPQLESRAVPADTGMEWRSPWGETFRFYPKQKPTREMLAIFKDVMEGRRTFFSPCSDGKRAVRWASSPGGASPTLQPPREDGKAWRGQLRFAYGRAPLRPLPCSVSKVSAEVNGLSGTELRRHCGSKHPDRMTGARKRTRRGKGTEESGDFQLPKKSSSELPFIDKMLNYFK